MIDANGAEVSGLGGAGLTLTISKNGAAFVASAGTKAEIANGWYTYLSTATEADTIGVVAIRVTGAGCVQQNLEYVVQQRNPGAIAFTYTVTDSGSGLPIEGVEVTVTTDAAGNNVVFSGDTDSFGVLRDDDGNLPYLDAGTYYFFSQKANYSFTNPDSEVVS